MKDDPNTSAIRLLYFLDLAAVRRSPVRDLAASRAFPRRYSSLESRVLQIQVVFQFVKVHDAGHGNPILILG